MMSTSLRPDDDGVDGLIVVVTTGTFSVGVVVSVNFVRILLNTPHSVYNNGSCKYIECVYMQMCVQYHDLKEVEYQLMDSVQYDYYQRS